MSGAISRDAIAERVAAVTKAIFPVPATVEGALGAFVAKVAHTNERLDLTAASTPDDLVDLLLADALVLASAIPTGARVVDVGSGAGAPGLALAIARPDVTMTLVEPLQKRVSFLRVTAVEVLGARSMPRVVRARGEDVATRGERFDVAISRATLAPAEWLSLGASLAPVVWVLLARSAPPEHEGMVCGEVRAYSWPLTRKDRTAACYAER